MERKTSARYTKKYTMHSLRPQLELELSGDRALAMLEEAAAKDAEAMARLHSLIQEDDAGRPPAIQEPASRRPLEFR